MKPLRYLLLFLGLVVVRAAAEGPQERDPAIGAWRISGSPERVMIVTPGYWTMATFDQERRQFLGTMGGTHRQLGERSQGVIQFDSENRDSVGGSFEVGVSVEGDRMTIVQEDGSEEQWTKIDDGDTPLAGTWRITSRKVGDGMQDMPLRARRTLKILSGTRFQWVAFNVDTGEFSGTGGGTYTYQDGKYVETIEFFSRDGSRVGASLEFTGDVNGDEWRHRGLSSRGDPIDEVWSRFEDVR